MPASSALEKVAFDEVYQEALAIFDNYKPRYSGDNLFKFDFTSPKVDRKVERPGTNFTTMISATLTFGAGNSSGGLHADSYEFWKFMKAHPGHMNVLIQAYTDASKDGWPRVEASIREHLMDPRFAGHVLSNVVGYQDSQEWDDPKVLKVGGVQRSGRPSPFGPQTIHESVTVDVVLQARKKEVITKAPFDAMSDTELNGWIQRFESDAPENFWMDGELHMSRPQAYAMYRKQWRALSPRDQTNMMNSLKGSRMASRVASRWAAQSASDQFARNVADNLRLLKVIEVDIKKTQREFAATGKADWGYAGSQGHVRDLLTQAHEFLSGTGA